MGCGEGRKYIFRVLVSREHHHLRARHQLLQAPHALDAVDAGKVDVHEHDIRFLGRQRVQRGFGGGELAEAAEARLAVDEPRQGAAQLVVVLHNGNGGCHDFRVNG